MITLKIGQGPSKQELMDSAKAFNEGARVKVRFVSKNKMIFVGYITSLRALDMVQSNFEFKGIFNNCVLVKGEYRPLAHKGSMEVVSIN